jgi:hypothetical protein
MSVASILGADGKIAASFGGSSGGALAGTVTNPLTANLDCSGFEVGGASYVRTDVVECETLEPKLLGGFIECVADLQMGVGAEIRSERVVADELRVREGGVEYASITYGDGFNELKLRPADNVSGGSVSIQQGGGAQPQLNFYDVSAAVFGNVFLDGAAALRTDSDLRIRKAAPALRFDNASGKVATVSFDTVGNAIELRTPSDAVGAPLNYYTAGGAPPSLNMINTATGVTTNLTSTGSSLQCSRDLQVVKTLLPAVTLTDASGTPISATLRLQRTGPSAGILQATQNLVIASTAGELGLQRLSIQPGAAGNFIVDGVTVTNTAPTLTNDSFINVVIGGTTYQLALKRA